MPQSLTQIYLHVVFSTKDRQRFLMDEQLRQQMHAYLAGACNKLSCPAVQIGGVADHVHVLCRLGKSMELQALIRELKRESSKWAKEQDRRLGEFHWQKGYGAFSVSPAHVEGLKQYIFNQEEHHKTESFQDEFRRLCRKYGVPLNEQQQQQYVWD